jgi:hypothetical protein
MTNLVDTYKNLTKLEKEVYDDFHKDILLSGNGISCGTSNLTAEKKGALGSLVKKSILNFVESFDGEEYYSSLLIDENNNSLI